LRKKPWILIRTKRIRIRNTGFYVTESYNRRRGIFSNLSAREARKCGIPIFAEKDPAPSPVLHPLRLMDLCSGACGLSNGLEQAGVARACWAVKNFPSGSDRVAEPCHFSAAPEPSIFFTAPEPAPAPTDIASVFKN
jgi:hypothetical protein